MLDLHLSEATWKGKDDKNYRFWFIVHEAARIGIYLSVIQEVHGRQG